MEKQKDLEIWNTNKKKKKWLAKAIEFIFKNDTLFLL